MDFSVTILGNGSAVPTDTQNPTAQLVRYQGQRFLIDCGEGTQMQMIKYHTGFKNLRHIFISHLHGDHFFGLVGLLSTFHLFGRKEPLHLYGPSDLKSFLDLSFKISNTTLLYPLFFHSTEDKDSILYEDENLTISKIPLKHSLPTTGFLFAEKKRPRKLNKAFVTKYQPSIAQMKAIKTGRDYHLPSGGVLENHLITSVGKPQRKYAYCSDTAYDERIVPFIQGVDLLYHESTFENAALDKALNRLHSTAMQAATIAQMAKVKKLLLGHYSARMNNDFSVLLSEARSIFKPAFLSEQGVTYAV